MNILVLGGTSFMGRHFVQGAVSDGHQITLFNRGDANPELFPTADSLAEWPGEVVNSGISHISRAVGSDDRVFDWTPVFSRQ